MLRTAALLWQKFAAILRPRHFKTLMLPGLDGTGGLPATAPQRKISAKFPVPCFLQEAGSRSYRRARARRRRLCTKPFSMREVVARFVLFSRAQRAGRTTSRNCSAAISMIDPMAHSVMVSGRTVGLSALEFRFLHYLASPPGMVFSRDQLLDRAGNDRPSRLAASTSTSACAGKNREPTPAAHLRSNRPGIATVFAVNGASNCYQRAQPWLFS